MVDAAWAWERTGPEADFGFTGHFYHQKSGLHLAYYRAYSAELGRWLSSDPAGESARGELYQYCNGNPLNSYDPDGLAPSSVQYLGTEVSFDTDKFSCLELCTMNTEMESTIDSFTDIMNGNGSLRSHHLRSIGNALGGADRAMSDEDQYLVDLFEDNYKLNANGRQEATANMEFGDHIWRETANTAGMREAAFQMRRRGIHFLRLLRRIAAASDCKCRCGKTESQLLQTLNNDDRTPDL